MYRATGPNEKGRIAIVTNAGRAAVDAGHIGAKSFAGRVTVSEALAPTTGAVRVRQNHLYAAVQILRCHLSHSGPWVPGRRPVFPAPFSYEGEAKRQSSGEMSREDAQVCPQMSCPSQNGAGATCSVIASAAKQSRVSPRMQSWIASLRSQ
ncbi:hypothetical protein ABIA03_007720 [Bradyrhizobium yuanmingense]|uniref:Uncharacterized protein n=1 Tax=Bradyrhizobium yuanmingense TaxID=108015 RepID=A0ABV4GQI0_9BRAD